MSRDRTRSRWNANIHLPSAPRHLYRTVKGREWYQEGETAEEYDEWRFSKGGAVIDDGEKERLFGMLGDVEGRSVLDVACGTGRFSVAMGERGADVTGVDISAPMLRQARRKAASRDVDVGFLRGDGKRLPFPDDAVDVVTAMRFFHLADDPAAYLAEMKRVARDAVVFDTFMRSSARVLYTRFLPMGSRLYDEDDVRDFVEEAGLELAERDADFYFPFGLYRVTPKAVASAVRGVDESLQSAAGDRFCSVGYWRAEP